MNLFLKNKYATSLYTDLVNKNVWRLVGRLVFWLSWPVWYVYLRIGRRTRVVIVSGSYIVVTRGWLGDGKWGLPGGGIHKNEDPRDGAVREVFEETGIQLAAIQLKHLGNDTSSKSGLRFRYEQYFISMETQVPVRFKGWEIADARWLPLKELNSANCEAATMDTVTRWREQA